MTVLEAADGDKGLELARAEHPDVVLLDVMMRGGAGGRSPRSCSPTSRRGASRYLPDRARGDQDRAKGIDLGGVDYVTKPFNPVELAPLVRTSSAASRVVSETTCGGEVRRGARAARAGLAVVPRDVLTVR